MARKRAIRPKPSVASSSSSGSVRVREEDSDEDVVFTPSSTSRKRRKLASDSDSGPDSESNDEIKSEGEQSQSCHQDKIRKKNKIRSCLDSSDEDEENTDVNIKTPKLERMKKLQQMSKNVQAKKGIYVSSEEEKISDDSEDDDDLPMFQNEEELPEQALKSVETVNEDSNLEDFVVEDDVVEMENHTDDEDEEDEAESTDSEDEDETKPVKRSKRLKKARNVLKKKKESEDIDSGEEDEDNPYSYANPYKEMDEAFDKSDILDILSKNTANDKKNAKLYKKEMGKYQFAVRSEGNKAAKLSKKARFAINMDQVKTDRGFKAERNLDVKDEEFYDYVEKNMFGESVRIFPHTKRVSMYNQKCSLGGCSERFSAGETAVIGATKFNEFNLMFMKKTNRFGKESFYYICAKHVPSEGGSDSEYSSGE